MKFELIYDVIIRRLQHIDDDESVAAKEIIDILDEVVSDAHTMSELAARVANMDAPALEAIECVDQMSEHLVRSAMIITSCLNACIVHRANADKSFGSILRKIEARVIDVAITWSSVAAELKLRTASATITNIITIIKTAIDGKQIINIKNLMEAINE